MTGYQDIDFAGSGRRLRLETLIRLRWLAVAGQTISVIVVALWLDFPLPLLASAYGFCSSEAKTPDHFFTGFPSYWNVVALYLYALDWPIWANVGTLFFLSVMVFVPIRYLYPSRTATLRAVTYVGGALWAISVFALLLQFPNPSRRLAMISLLFPAYYIALSFWLHWRTPPSPRHVPG